MEIDKSKLVKRVERPGQRFLMYHGESFRYEKLPVGARVIYPPPPLPPIEDPNAAIANALENPLGQDPLSEQLRPGMKVTIAFDDISLPLPPMTRPDIRQRIVEAVLNVLAKKGVDNIHLVAALGLHRRMTPSELKRALGRKVFNRFHPDRLYNFDAEDRENLVVLGTTEHGEEVETSKRVADSDLLIYVNINLSSMDGGHKSINTGLVSYKTIRHHHNVHTLMRCGVLHGPDPLRPPRFRERHGKGRRQEPERVQDRNRSELQHFPICPCPSTEAGVGLEPPRQDHLRRQPLGPKCGPLLPPVADFPEPTLALRPSGRCRG